MQHKWRVGVEQIAMSALEHGAGDRNRTDDLLITNQLLYQLSYTGKGRQVYGGERLGNNKRVAIY